MLLRKVILHVGSQGCTHGDVQLVGGKSESEGWAQVCYNGSWYSLCKVDDEAASVICKQLGHTTYPCEQRYH